MRKAILIGVALVAALALSVGAFAYPMVVGTHSLSTAHAAAPATVNHPKTGDDNSTGNQTNENETGDSGNQTHEYDNETSDNDTGENETAPVPPPPEANETENESEMSMMGNVTVDHNVTVTQVDNVTYVNGTITVVQNGTDLVTVTFAIVAQDNGTANATINVTQTAGSETITVHGFAVYSTEDHGFAAFGVVKATQNGSVLWWKPFVFGSDSGCSGY